MILLTSCLLFVLLGTSSAEKYTYRKATKEDLRRLTTSKAATAPPTSNSDIASGTRFVFSYLNSHLSSQDTGYTENLYLTVSNPGSQTANVKIWSLYPQFNNQTVTVTGGTSNVYQITPISIQVDYMDYQNASNIVRETKSIWVESDVAVKLVATNQRSDGTSEDKFAVIPICQLGKTYMGVVDESTRFVGSNATNYVTIIAVNDNTLVKYLGLPLIPLLKKGQQYTVALSAYISGLPIVSNDTVAVISGSACGFGYYQYPMLQCSHESLMMYPQTAFDTQYPFFKFQPEDYAEVMVFVTDDNTVVYVDSDPLPAIDADSIWMFRVYTGVYFHSSKTIYAVTIGTVNSQNQGAPYIAHVPSPKLFTPGPIMFATAMTDIEANTMSNFARVITSIDFIGKIAVDSYTPNALIYRRMGQSDYYFVDVQISPKMNHVVTSGNGGAFAVTVYGYGNLRSYAFNPGLNLPTNGQC